jgi:hypothetical protein
VGTLLVPTAALADDEKQAVYTITNSASGNEVLAFHRAANGQLGAADGFQNRRHGNWRRTRLRAFTRRFDEWPCARRRKRGQQLDHRVPC